MPLATTIDEVVDRLSEIIEASYQVDSKLGYFPALYRRVTIAIREDIGAGRFEDPARMEALDVVFANRYLEAYDGYQAGNLPISACWRYAFDATLDYWPTATQHLLLGINAHINLDLGVAAARVVGKEPLAPLQADFDRINTILSSLLESVQEEIAQIWPPFGWIDHWLGDVEEGLINFSMGVARNEAWKVALSLHGRPFADQEVSIRQLDRSVLKVARLIRHPGYRLGTLLRFVRFTERGSAQTAIDVLHHP